MKTKKEIQEEIDRLEKQAVECSKKLHADLTGEGTDILIYSPRDATFLVQIITSLNHLKWVLR